MLLMLLDIGTGFEKAANTLLTLGIVLLLFSIFTYKFFSSKTAKKWMAGLITLFCCLVIANISLLLISKVNGGIPFQSFFDVELITLTGLTSALSIGITFTLAIIDSIKNDDTE